VHANGFYGTRNETETKQTLNNVFIAEGTHILPIIFDPGDATELTQPSRYHPIPCY